MMTREEAVAEIAMRVPRLPPKATREILAAADQDAKDGGRRVEMILRSYVADGIAPDRTGWQVFGDVLAEVPELAALAGPIVSLAMAIAPFV